MEFQTEAWQLNEERIGYLIDNTVAPCDDFFQYACSSKKRGKEFPYARKDVTLNLTDLIVKVHLFWDTMNYGEVYTQQRKTTFYI